MALTPRQLRATQNWRDELGRWHAGRLGLKINKGSWLLSPTTGRPVVQGYRGLYHRAYRVIWQAFEFNQESS